MNKIVITLILILSLMAGCSSINNTDKPENNLEKSKPLILTTFYPVEEITKAIVKDTANVEVLIGIGIEPHSFEPTPTQIVKLSKTNTFVTMGGMFENIEEEIIKTNPSINIIESTNTIDKIKGDDHENEEHEEHEDEEYDPHVWLSIHNMESMTNEISKKLIEKYPNNKETYETNANLYIEKLKKLENEFQNKLSTCENEEIIVNHKAFGYLEHEYGFKQVSIAGFTPESEPSPKTIQKVIDQAKEHNLKYIYSEGQLDSKVSKTIAKDIDGEVLELNPLKLNENEDYFTIMRNNLNNLAIGLNCSE